jgi:hypothetical protein
MSRFQFELAQASDDAELRQIMATTPMPGHIAVSLQREPSWFEAAAIDGHFRQVVACRDLLTGRLVGFGCRSVRRLLVNGRPSDVGYLSSLRALPEGRNRGLLARGYAFFRRLHQDGRAPFYLTTIALGNEPALALLTSGRAGLPAYDFAGRYRTMALALPRRPPRSMTPSGVIIRPARTDDLPAVLDFLSKQGSRRQFFPQYHRADFTSPDGQLRGLELDGLLLAERGGCVVGTIAAWDQRAFRQSMVHSYSAGIRLLRPLYNAVQRMRGFPGLPAAGRPLPYLTAALPVVADDNRKVFAALICELRRRYAGTRWSHLLLGLHESDPLIAVARRFETIHYTTLLYLVGWEDSRAARAALDKRPAYLELGTL